VSSSRKLLVFLPGEQNPMKEKKTYYKEAIQAEVFDYIRRAAQELGQETYVVGGYVRDYLLERPLKKDIDIVTVGSGIRLAEKTASLMPHRPKVKVFKTYGTAMLRFWDTEVEFVGARKE
jgi:tRNA nucleotidyltransferase/poly(A) polymerase